MVEEPIISVSGLRGIIGRSLTPEVAMRYACALASELPPGLIVITRDGRSTGRMLADVIRGALMAMGRNVLDADVAATPTTGLLVRELRAAGGIQISASHNPPEYNGLKLFGGAGRVISAGDGQRILDRYRSGSFSWKSHEALGTLQSIDDPHAAHLQKVLQTVNVDRIRARKYRVLLDANHGAGALLGRRLLQELGCDVTVLGAEPNGNFAHVPEPTAENLSGVCQQVAAVRAVVGFCQDPDADRLALIDERGEYVGEEYTVAICLNHVLRSRRGAVVTNCSTSRMSEEITRGRNLPFFRAKVGEANVCDLMIAENAVFGGEGNGGPIDPQVGYVRDSFVGMAIILDAMAATGKSISLLAADLPRYAIHKAKVSLSAAQVSSSFDRLEQYFAEATASRLDGLRLDWPGKWLLVRASNTEPIVRLIAEAESADEARRLCDEAAAAISATKHDKS